MTGYFNILLLVIGRTNRTSRNTEFGWLKIYEDWLPTSLSETGYQLGTPTCDMSMAGLGSSQSAGSPLERTIPLVSQGYWDQETRREHLDTVKCCKLSLT